MVISAKEKKEDECVLGESQCRAHSWDEPDDI